MKRISSPREPVAGNPRAHQLPRRGWWVRQDWSGTPDGWKVSAVDAL
ncbi:hypothetical protein [Actinacidiphila soli]|nr:hypothetical protein [Actinacidiphila soli]